jgi:hypothetical protein
VGKRVSIFTAISILAVVLAFTFWGCSENNPAGNGTTALRGGSDDGLDPFDIDTDIDDDGGKPPEWPEIEGGKFSDSLISDHLIFDSEKSIFTNEGSALIDRAGGTISVGLDGNAYRLYVLPHNVMESTEFTMLVRKGSNEFNEELHVFTFTPVGLEFNLYSILEFGIEPDHGIDPTPVYTLYYWAAGTWIKYSDWTANNEGLAKFYIPHFSTYAILKQGGSDYRPPDGFDF